MFICSVDYLIPVLFPFINSFLNQMVEMNGEEMIIYRQINLHDKFRHWILNLNILY